MTTSTRRPGTTRRTRRRDTEGTTAILALALDVGRSVLPVFGTVGYRDRCSIIILNIKSIKSSESGVWRHAKSSLHACHVCRHVNMRMPKIVYQIMYVLCA